MPRRKPHPATRPRGTGRELLFGTHAVLAALANPQRKCRALWATRNAANRHAEALGAAPLEPSVVTSRELDRIAGADAVHQGLALEAGPLPSAELGDLAHRGPLVVLDQVTDPHNVGAVLRSCAVFGAEALVMTARNAPALTGTVAKAASGALEHVAVIKVGNLARALDELSAAGYELIGLDGDADDSLQEFEPSGPFALVLGAEGKGLRHLTREHCDRLLRIGTDGAISSLNVSNAAAVALYATTFGRKRRQD